MRAKTWWLSRATSIGWWGSWGRPGRGRSRSGPPGWTRRRRRRLPEPRRVGFPELGHLRRDHSLAVHPLRVMLEVLLVVGFRRIEYRKRGHLGHDRCPEDPLGREVRDDR